MSVQRCQQEITSTEFMDWIIYLEMDINTFHRMDYFLAQISCVIAKTFGGKKAKSLRIEDFLLKFKAKRDKRKKMTKEDKLKVQKQRWFHRVGLIKKKGD